jgi:BMFP domain-containing protein YqiC
MRRLILLIFLVYIGIFAADVKIPVQGYLTDNNGVALNGEKSVTFTLYDLDENGNELWTENATVNIENGEFSYMLGTTDFIDSTILENDTPLYLEIKVEDEVLTPRIEIGVEPRAIFSYKSQNSDKLSGKNLTEIKDDIKNDITENKLQSIINRLDALEAENNQLKSRVTALENKNNELTSRIQTLEAKVNANTEDISYLNVRFNSHMENYNILVSQFTDTYDQVVEINNKLDLITVTEPINLDDLTTRVDNNEDSINDLETETEQNTYDLNDNNGKLSLLSDRVSNLEVKTADMSIVYLYGHKTVRFSHVNVQIVNGSGHTDERYSDNGMIDGQGLGNLIVGYNEEFNYDGEPAERKTGFHNIVIGTQNDYTSFGGFVAGLYNVISGEYAVVTGGIHNGARGDYSVISGGSGRFVYGESDWKAGELFEDN